MKRLSVLTAIATLFISATSLLAAYPERPITLIVPWSAGGGTDAVGRIIAQGLQEQLGQPVNVVNRTGAGGIVGHSAMTKADPDGYTIGLATAEITTYKSMGTSKITFEDLEPIGLVNFDASAFHISTKSSWKNVQEALDDIKQNFGKYKMSGMPVGAAYHLAFSGFLNDNGIDPKAVPMVPSQGAAPGFQELASGGVHIVPSSLPEAIPMRQAKRVHTLAVLADKRLDAFPDVPTMEEAIGKKAVGGTWRGIVTPKGVSDEVKQKLETTLKTIFDSDAYQEFMKKRGFGVKWLPSGEFAEFMKNAHENNAKVIAKLGLSK
jgi:tripartite-type tricarboxylate transporter receptor subunit TctC